MPTKAGLVNFKTDVHEQRTKKAGPYPNLEDKRAQTNEDEKTKKETAPVDKVFGFANAPPSFTKENTPQKNLNEPETRSKRKR